MANVILAGPLTDRTANAELAAYENVGHSVCVNTWYLSEHYALQLRQRQTSPVGHFSVCHFDPADAQQLVSTVLNDGGYEAIIYPPHLPGFTAEVLHTIQKTGLSRTLHLIGCPDDALHHLAAVREDASQAGVTIVNTPGIHAGAVGQHTLLRIHDHTAGIAHHRSDSGDLYAAYREAATGSHPDISQWSGQELTLGVIGAGKDGLAVIQRAVQHGMQVLALDPYAEQAVTDAGAQAASSLEDLLPRVDFLSVHCPVNDATRGMLNWETLSQAKPGTVIFLFSYPEVANICDLTRMLTEQPGHIGGLFLDMPVGGLAAAFDPENPANRFNDALREHGAVITLRIAGMTDAVALDAVQRLAVEVNQALQPPVPQWKR